MSLTPGFDNVCDLFEKLKRDAALLDDEVTSDRLFNFCVTGWSMIDWVRNDSRLPGPARDEATNGSIYSQKWIKICGDLANASKHFCLDKRKPITDSATSNAGWGVGRFGKGHFGVGEECIVIVLNDGTSFTSAELVTAVVSFWQDFLVRDRV